MEAGHCCFLKQMHQCAFSRSPTEHTPSPPPFFTAQVTHPYLQPSWSGKCPAPPCTWVHCGRHEPMPGSSTGSCCEHWLQLVSVEMCRARIRQYTQWKRTHNLPRGQRKRNLTGKWHLEQCPLPSSIRNPTSVILFAHYLYIHLLLGVGRTERVVFLVNFLLLERNSMFGLWGCFTVYKFGFLFL